MASSRRRHTSAQRISHSGWFESRAGGTIQPATESGATHPSRPAMDYAEARDGEQSQTFDIAPGAVDGSVHILPGSIDIDLFAEGIIAPEVVDALPALPDASYPIGYLVFLTTDEKLYRNPDDVAWTAAVDGADIIANSITAGQIAAGAIGAEQLASEIILGGLIIAGDPDAAHLELDSDGLRIFNASLDLILNAPTDGSEIYINAAVEALSLTVPGDAVFQGDANQFAISSVTELMAQQQAPSQAPTLAQGWASLTLPVNATYDLSSTKYTRQGLAYDAAGGAGGATKVFYQISEDSDGQMILLELLASDRTVNRSYATGADSLSYYRPSVVRHGDWIYIYYSDFSFGRHVERVLASSFAHVDYFHSISLPGELTRPWDHQICSDGTNPYIVGVDEFGVIKWNKYNDSMVKQGSTINTTHSPDGSDTTPVGAYAGNADFGAFRIAVQQYDGTVFTYNSSGSLQANENFDTPDPASFPSNSRGLTYGDAAGDGARFWSLPHINNIAAQTIGKHSTWTWTSASAKYWVGYSWYDSAGTTHETTVSPRGSITMGRRKQLTVTMQSPLPGAGGADDPDNRRVYMFPNSSAPATTSLDLQATTSSASALLVTYDSGGAAPPTVNDFPAGTPAVLKSSTAGWSLNGSGEFFVEEIDFGITTQDIRLYRESANMLAMPAGDGIRLRSTQDQTLTGNNHPLTIGNDGGVNIAFDNNEIQARDNGAASELFLNKDGGAVTISSSARVTVQGGLTVTGGGVANNGTLILSDGAIRLSESGSAPSVAGANTVLIYADDNGSGKTRLRARFNTGAIQTLATEP